MYTENQDYIRSGLVNYLGALIKNSHFEDNEKTRHNVVAITLEEILKICKDDNELYNLFVCKPLLRANISILKQRIACLSELPQEPLIIDKINSYKIIINELEKIIDVVVKIKN